MFCFVLNANLVLGQNNRTTTATRQILETPHHSELIKVVLVMEVVGVMGVRIKPGLNSLSQGAFTLYNPW